MKTEIFKTKEDFFNRENKEVNGVSPEFAETHKDWKKMNESNKGCWDCSDCSDCSGCSYCSDCSDCSDCSNVNNKKESFKVPVLEEIHNQVLSACENPEALEMDIWHTCDTTHCRAGWVVTLAGKEGKELEEKTSTLFAAMQICKKSSDIKVSPVRFFESNEIAMKDIERCSLLENEPKNAD